MDADEYQHWCKLQEVVRAEKNKDGVIQVGADDNPEMDAALFEAVSKRSWTDVLLQILKVRVTANDPFALRYEYSER